MKGSISGVAVKKVFIPFFVILLAASALIAGCGSSQTAQIGNPVAFFEKAREGITDSVSFRMTGEIFTNYSYSAGSREFQINYEMLFEKQEDDFLVRMLMQTPAQGSALQGTASGQKIETYLTKDKLYLKYPATGQWFFKAFDLGFDITAIDQGFSPQGMLKMLDSAATIEVVDETSSLIKYHLTLDFEKLMAEVDVDKYFEAMKKNGLISFDLGEYLEMLKNFISQMQLYLTVDKKSQYPIEFDMVIDKNILEYMRDFLSGSSLPPEASMTMSMNFSIGDYGKAFNLRLPEEAMQARPWAELPQGSTSS
jgi:hypothetical protein